MTVCSVPCAVCSLYYKYTLLSSPSLIPQQPCPGIHASPPLTRGWMDVDALTTMLQHALLHPLLHPPSSFARRSLDTHTHEASSKSRGREAPNVPLNDASLSNVLFNGHKWQGWGCNKEQYHWPVGIWPYSNTGLKANIIQWYINSPAQLLLCLRRPRHKCFGSPSVPSNISP